MGDIGEMQRVIAPVLKRLYPANLDVVIGREARQIAAALIDDGWTRKPGFGVFVAADGQPAIRQRP